MPALVPTSDTALLVVAAMCCTVGGSIPSVALAALGSTLERGEKGRSGREERGGEGRGEERRRRRGLERSERSGERWKRRRGERARMRSGGGSGVGDCVECMWRVVSVMSLEWEGREGSPCSPQNMVACLDDHGARAAAWGAEAERQTRAVDGVPIQKRQKVRQRTQKL